MSLYYYFNIGLHECVSAYLGECAMYLCVNSFPAVSSSKSNNLTVMLPINKQNPASLLIWICLGKHNDVLAWPGFSIVLRPCHGGSGEDLSI